MKRTDYINWDEYFMGIALLTAMRSKDPNSQVRVHRQLGKQNSVLGLQRYAHWLQRRRDALGAGGRTAGHQVYVRVPRRAERHPQQRPQ